ncbi:8-oxo-dGTP pyrophosphatase MutT (NUDIX family) [Allocatelliglobosispora scoriae]|uniref:8-oxo-dGTP pyrophosphatase MutT (NUDIX family) n=1 Tax=Allocatelliglobosispora scoriae TaxID=643052 RepID=A0A841BH43_9ACTN|nr:NUDIX domain-containing protein [Allocatelliglobosispora scoriae]MBB5866628.1 8-oxo-dGTP pyrophosphatase MutT (NUDIX family) [Allocatelliglobosispora scoriae]
MLYTSVVDVLLLLTRGDQVLLALRDGTGYADGQYNLPSGKLEADETLIDALIRETQEEIGIRLDPAEVHHAATVHCRNPEGARRIGVMFTAVSMPERQGEPFNAEPHKCAMVGWFPLDMLPRNTVPYTVAGVELFRSGQPFGLIDWR